MQMHQIRYFLAVAETLNFTRAASDCHVSQPSLTRAIKLLEYELGGDLLRRERGHTHLTDLGTKMLPLLMRCYESATAAKSIAVAMNTGTFAVLNLALPDAVDLAPFMPPLVELLGSFDQVGLRLTRGSTVEVAAKLRDGSADLALSTPAEMEWTRFESWPLFDEAVRIAFSKEHPLAQKRHLALADLRNQTILLRPFCETSSAIVEALQADAIDVSFTVEAANDNDVIAFLRARIGVAIAPESVAMPADVLTAPIDGLRLRQSLRVFSVAGRQRSPAASLLLTQLRAADWSRLQRPTAATA